MLSENLYHLRKLHKLSQEQVAECLDVSRQAVAKWESGETAPDIHNCLALAELYDVSLDDLVNYESTGDSMMVPPRGKHLFGVVTVGEKGQIVIPKQARKIFHIEAGDRLVVLGDEAQGIAMVKAEEMMHFLNRVQQAMGEQE
ncbi:MAG: helix-turn-helix domain-containing protein [Lachnospiraceae bacterium]|nr:helix-turn-helix domain-containing protein [Lachnospiraceae bacterium]